MKRNVLFVVTAVLLQTVLLSAQAGKIAIQAGTPEDVQLQAITSEQDPVKKLAMYQDFVQKFSSNPAAVVYGNWQIAQYYQSTGDAQKALDYGDKALAAEPDDLDILVMQAGNAQQVKDSAKVMDYSTRGAKVYNSIGTQPKPDGVSDQDFASQNKDEKTADQSSYDFLEAAAYNAIVGETNPKTRMAYIERFTPAFPDSRYADSITAFEMDSLSRLNDNARLIAYAEKLLAANPNNLTALVLLSNTYVDDPKPGSAAKGITYAQKAIAVAKADAADADRPRKLSAGAAHSALGRAYLKQDKTAAAIQELKAAVALLKGQDDQAYAAAAYYLGFSYAKLRQLTEARDVLTAASRVPGPAQAMIQDLLTKVNTARAGGK